MNYKTRFTLLGLPLVHIASGKLEEGRYNRGIAKGWIAVGDISFGVIFSVGGVAFGGVAIGGLAVGLMTFAGLALGFLALGGGAIGVLASGGGALAWRAAYGGFAAAVEFAQGGWAIANHANDSVAHEFFENSYFFSFARLITEHSRWLLFLLVVPIAHNLLRRMSHPGAK
jgi:hypothetical protein